MKRKYGLLAWLICFVMVLSLAGCGKKDEPKTDTPTEQAKNDNPNDKPTESAPDNPTETPAGTIEDALKKAPEHYDFAVEVSINPAFLLFVSGNEVIGYQALNDDAKQIEGRCAIVGRGIEGAVEDIVKASHQDGFLKDGGEVDLTVVSANCAKSDADEVLDRAFHTVERVAQECNVSVKPEIHVENDVVFATDPDPNRPGPDDPDPNGPDPNDPNNQDPPEPGTSEPRKDEGCSVCQGTGACERCDATGVVECMSCNGSGQTVKDCWKCKGSGKDESGNTCAECGGVGNHGTETCRECNGAGQTECEQCHGTKKCPACGGTGKKPD